MGIRLLGVDDYKRQFPASGRALALHEALRPLLQEDKPVAGNVPQLGVSAVEGAWVSGKPVIGRMNLGPSAGPLRQILQKVCQTLMQHMPTLGPISVLADPAKVADRELLQLAQEIAEQNASAIQQGVRATGAHPTGTAFAVAFAVSVFYHAARKHLPKDVDLSVWQRQSCPVCAATPSIAKETVGHGRLAYCHRCSTTWAVPQDLCLACGTRDARGARRVELPGDLARWAEVCRACHQYTKIVSEPRLGAVPDLYYEDVVTLPLDQLAQEAATRSDEPVLVGTR